VRSDFLTRLRDTGLDSITQDVALEFREHGEHAGQGSAAGGGHAERLRERYEADSNGMEFLKCRNQAQQPPLRFRYGRSIDACATRASV